MRSKRKAIICSSAALVAVTMLHQKAHADVNPIVIIGNEVGGPRGSGDTYYTNPPTDTTTGSTGLGIPWYNGVANDSGASSNGPATNNVGWQVPGGGTTSHNPFTMVGAIGSVGSPAIGATEGVSSMKVTTPGILPAAGPGGPGPGGINYDTTGDILGAEYSANSSAQAFMQGFTSSNLIEADITLTTAPTYVADGSSQNDALGVYFRLTYKDEDGGPVDSGGNYSGYKTTTNRAESYVTFNSASPANGGGETGTKTMIWNYGELAGPDNTNAGALGLDDLGSSFYVRLDLDSSSKNPITYYIDNIRFASRQLTYQGGTSGTISNSANWGGLDTNAANAQFFPENGNDPNPDEPAYLANHVIINDALHFGLAGTHTVTNDETSFSPDADGAYGFTSNSQYGGLVFDAGAGAFTINGNAIDLAGDIDNNSTSLQTVSTALRLMDPINLNSVSGGTLYISGNISSYTAGTTGTLQGNQFGITVGGTGVVKLGGTNTYQGATTVNGNATLEFTGSSGYGGTALVLINPNGAAGVDTSSLAAGFLAKIANAFSSGWSAVPTAAGNVGTGALALSAVDASTNIDFTGTVGGAANLSAAGLSGLSIGALPGGVTYTGTITPPTTGSFANLYRLGGGATLTLPNGLTGAANSAEITNEGTVVMTGSSTYGGSTTVDSGATLNVGSATLAGALPSTSTLVSNGNSNFVANPGSGILVRTIGGISVSSTGQVVVANPTGGVHANRTVLVLGSTGLTFGGTVANPQGLVNLNGNDLIAKGVGATGLAGITSALAKGFNAHAGYWNGTAGIVSSTAAADTSYLTTLGSMQSQGGTFDGLNTTTSDVLVKYTYYGDANLDGSVNGADYQQIDAGFGSHLTGWQNGDFNYDGVVDGSDYSLIDNTFNQLHATGASPLVVGGAQIASPSDLVATTAVPEPTTLTLLGIGSMSLLGRRRSRKNTTAR
jgi:autotransporter-associated beta strand protein